MKKTKKKFDAAPILQQLAEIRKGLPHRASIPSRPASDGRALDVRTEEDFEYAALVEGLESLAADVSATVEHARAAATAKALEIYYAAEELSRDPEHADLIPLVEKMRAAYESDYGKPIPPKR